jgi:hypothetical protein
MEIFPGERIPHATIRLSRCELEQVKIAWRDACEDLQEAYDAWCRALPERCREGYTVVVAAADREAAAADALARAVAADGAAPWSAAA